MSSFATGCFAKRALAQSLGREFGPRGVHVSHAIIDGVIDIPRTKEWMVSDAPDAKISADAVSDPVLPTVRRWSVCRLDDGGHRSVGWCCPVADMPSVADCRCLLALAHSAEDNVHQRTGHQAVCREVVRIIGLSR